MLKLLIGALNIILTWYLAVFSQPSPNATPIIVGAEPAGGIVIAAAGDIACPVWYRDRKNECKEKETADLVQSMKPRAVLALGDLQYPDGSDWRGFDRSWGRFKSQIYPVPGNHEYETRGAEGYFNYFDKNGYYSFELGEWHVVAINSNCEIGACDAVAQRSWLENDLKKSSKKCSLAFMHHPLLSSGKEKGVKNMGGIWNILLKRGVDVVLAGHNHSYERFAPIGGIREFVVGTGGRSLYGWGKVELGSEVRVNDKFGVLKMVFYERAYEWEFVGIDGKTYDQGQDKCN